MPTVTLNNRAGSGKILQARNYTREDLIYPWPYTYNPDTGIYVGNPANDPYNFVSFFDDFLGTDISETATGTGTWTLLDVAGGTELILAGSSTIPNGQVALHLAATDEVEQAGISWGNNLDILKSKKPIFECRLAMHVLPSLDTAGAGTEKAKAFFGLMTAAVATTTTVTDYSTATQLAGFSMAASGLVNCETDDNTTDTAPVTSGITLVADAYHTFRIDCSTLTSVKFYIDDAQVASSTTFDFSANATGLQPVLQVEKNKTTNNSGLADMYIDWVRVSWQR